ncbi:MAG TPA: polyprenyl synthetase family protein [Gaiellaceae bacterium]
MSAVRSYEPLDLVRDTSGLKDYLEAVERRLDELFAGGSGTVDLAAQRALRSGGKRLRPMLSFLSAPSGQAPPAAAGVAVELIHLASLMHDDLLDDATVRRGAPSTWNEFGKRAALASGDRVFALAFRELAGEGRLQALATLAETALALARGEALQRELRFDPNTSVEAQLRLCSLKTGSLFSAACRLGASGGDDSLGEYGLALGIAFQIVDDVLDCVGQASETGKAPGTDLREGIPTLPLIFAAERDERVRSALAGSSCEGVLERVAGSGALERAQEIAQDYARKACSYLNGDSRSRELAALAQAVLERKQ